MAKITKSDRAPADVGTISIGSASFDLPRKNSVYETDDPLVISSARANPFLSVEEDAPAAAPADAPVADALDPHVTPQADHLSAYASQAAKDAAAANEAAIRESTGLDQTFRNDSADEPTIQESLQATFDTLGIDTAPAVAVDAEEQAEQPAPTTDTNTEEQS